MENNLAVVIDVSRRNSEVLSAVVSASCVFHIHQAIKHHLLELGPHLQCSLEQVHEVSKALFRSGLALLLRQKHRVESEVLGSDLLVVGQDVEQHGEQVLRLLSVRRVPLVPDMLNDRVAVDQLVKGKLQQASCSPTVQFILELLSEIVERVVLRGHLRACKLVEVLPVEWEDRLV